MRPLVHCAYPGNLGGRDQELPQRAPHQAHRDRWSWQDCSAVAGRSGPSIQEVRQVTLPPVTAARRSAAAGPGIQVWGSRQVRSVCTQLARLRVASRPGRGAMQVSSACHSTGARVGPSVVGLGTLASVARARLSPPARHRHLRSDEPSNETDRLYCFASSRGHRRGARPRVTPSPWWRSHHAHDLGLLTQLPAWHCSHAGCGRAGPAHASTRSRTPSSESVVSFG